MKTIIFYLLLVSTLFARFEAKEVCLYLGGQGQDLSIGLKQDKAIQGRCKSAMLDKAGFVR